MKDNYRILLVEDDHCIRNLMEEILIDEGYQLTSVHNGQEAVKRLSANEYHLLITDFRMPHLNGVELLKWCRENQKDIPVIFMTANSPQMNDDDMSIEDISTTLIHKPLNLELFLDTVKTTLTC